MKFHNPGDKTFETDLKCKKEESQLIVFETL